MDQISQPDKPPKKYSQSVISWFFDFNSILIHTVKAFDQKAIIRFCKLVLTMTFWTRSWLLIKLGMSCIGCIPGDKLHYTGIKRDDLLDYCMILARHEELTFYGYLLYDIDIVSARILFQMIDDPTPELFDLAISTTGWGRIFAVSVNQHCVLTFFSDN
jgi:hypothetical protein